MCMYQGSGDGCYNCPDKEDCEDYAEMKGK